MRRFLITSHKFTGVADVLYNEMGTLCKIDLTQTNMDESIVQRFKNCLPSSVYLLINGHGFSKDTTIVEGDLNVTFDEFWKEYPLHRNRYKVEQLWNKMVKAEQVKAFYNLRGYKKYLNSNSWQSPMIADRYLRDKEYETDWNTLKTN